MGYGPLVSYAPGVGEGAPVTAGQPLGIDSGLLRLAWTRDGRAHRPLPAARGDPAAGSRPVNAVVLREAGGPEVLRIDTVPDPVPGPGEVVVALRTAALNRRDVFVRKGIAPSPLPVIPGSDGAGVVRALGPGVSGVAEGDEVIILPSLGWGGGEDAPAPGFRILGGPDDGTYAELIRIPAENVFPRPARLSWEEAGALPLAGLTAYRALVSRARIRSGETVLIIGIGGGVATIALHIARAAGCRVLVTSSSDDKIARAAELGAAGGVNYTGDDWPAAVRELAGGGVDVVVDSVGSTWAQSIATPAPRRPRGGLRRHRGRQGRADGPAGDHGAGLPARHHDGQPPRLRRAARRRREPGLGAGHRQRPPAGRGGRRAHARGGRRALRQAGALDLLMDRAPAARALAAARREIGRRAAAGSDDPTLRVDALAAAVEDDPRARRELDEAAAERRRVDRPEAWWEVPGPRAAREARRAEAHHAIDALVLAGELLPDGPGRVRLPGFGATTWRALALLRAGAPGAEGRWAAAVAAEPLADLGDAAPPGLRAEPDPRLAPAAVALHAWEARRQDIRNALMAAEAALATTLDAGHAQSARLLRDDLGELERALAAADSRIARAWEDGLREAGRRRRRRRAGAPSRVPPP